MDIASGRTWWVIVLCAGLVSIVLGTRDAAAQARGCLVNPGACSVAECVALQANVTSSCKSGLSGCRPGDGCPVLRSKRQQWLDCYTARNIINNRCFFGGDEGHQIAAAQAIQNVGTCDSVIALPEPEGCADPCP